MEILLTIVGILLIGTPLLVGLTTAFCIMFDEVFDTNIKCWLFDGDLLVKGLSIAGMLVILSLPVFVICYFLGILN